MRIAAVALLALIVGVTGFSRDRVDLELVRVKRAHEHNLARDWLTEAQKEELAGLDAKSFNEKYLAFYKDLSGLTKKSATQQIVKQCYLWLEDVASKDERNELEVLHHKDHAACKEKVREFLTRVPESERTEIEEHLDVCEEVWYATHSHNNHHGHHGHRRRRDHHHDHNFAEFVENHLGWLTAEQKAEVLKHKGHKDIIRTKINEFFEATTGELREQAVDALKGACRELVKHVLGHDKYKELKAFKESGASQEAIKTKLEELLGEVTDPTLKKEAAEHKEECLRLLAAPTRRRRDHHDHHAHGHKLEDYLKTHLSWLTEEQANELKQLKADGKSAEEIQKKVFQFYDAAEGETKTKATELLQGGCRELLKAVVGEEKAGELKTLRESGATKEELAKKADELVGAVTDEHKKELATKYGASCKRLFGVSSRRRRHEGQTGMDDFINNHLTWLTAEQKAEIVGLKEAGDKAAIKAKVHEFFEAATGETKEKATEELQGACRELMSHVLGEKTADVKALKESGASRDDIAKKIEELLGQVTDADLKAKGQEYKESCKKVFGVGASRRRRHDDHTLENFAKNHLTWLSDDQRDELFKLKDAGQDAIKAKVDEFYQAASGETREKATSELQNACRELISKVVGPEKAAELKALKESGASFSDIEAKVDSFLAEVTDESKKKLAETHKAGCSKLFKESSRKRRDHHDHHGHGHKLEDYLKTHLSWLTEEQANELKQLKADGKSAEEIQKKVFQFYDAAEGETKTKATELLQGGCRELLKAVVGEEKAGELKTLRESGATKEELAKKADELVGAVTDEHKKELATKYGASCKRLFGVSSRRRRHGSDVSWEDFYNNHLTWLTAEQKAEIVGLKEAGDKASIKAKVHEFFEAATGETKTKAAEELKGACRELMAHVLGTEQTAELKALKESGASNDEIVKKVEELLGQVTDEVLKAKGQEHKESCMKVFTTSKRRRRDHHDHHGHGHKLEDYLKTHLSWLTEEQANELKQLKADGKSAEEIQKKVFQFYDAAEGETKTKATELLQGGCRELLKAVVGEEKAGELKTLRESGATKEELAKKADELVGAVTDEHKKELATKYGASFKRLFGVSSRRRRDHHHHHDHNLEDFVKNHLSWLTAEQKSAVLGLKDSGKKAIKAKVHEFFEATTGETRRKAIEDFQAACREKLVHVVGAEKAAELKTLRDSGASNDELKKKVEELLAVVTDETLLKEANEHREDCLKFFGVSSRRRRDHHDHHGHGHKLEDYLKTHLSWLTEEQANELKQLKADGKSAEEIQKKVFQFYDAAEGETKTKATELLQGGCRELLKAVVGEEKAGELKTLRESGATKEELAKKADELVGAVTDEHKKELATKYGASCKRLFGVSSRRRRHEGQTGMDDFINNHLTWLTAEQKAEIVGLKEAGDKAAIKAKVHEFFEAATGETKEKATEELQGACRELMSHVLGEKTADVKALKESGASRDDIAKKIEELLGQVTDADLKAKGQEYKESCKKVFGVGASRRRRHGGVHDLDDFINNHLTWLSAEQKEIVMKLKGSPELKAKVIEFYGAAEGDVKTKATEELQGACRELMTNVLGADKVAEVKAMRESGAAKEDIAKKVEDLISQVPDATMKAEGEKYFHSCKKLFGVGASRKRRDHHHGHGHKLEEYLKTHLSWLTDAQAEELKGLKADGKSAGDIQKKVFQFYDAAEGETKTKATELLQGGCRELLRTVIGDANAEQISLLRESGASIKALDSKIAEFLREVTDEHKLALAKQYSGPCKKVFGVPEETDEDGVSRMRRTLTPTITHLDFIRAITKDDLVLDEQELAYRVHKIYRADDEFDKGLEIVTQCHSLFGEVLAIKPYLNDNSDREVVMRLREASTRQVKGAGAVAAVCMRAIKTLSDTEGRRGSIGGALVDLLEDLDVEAREQLSRQWKARCVDWTVEVTSAEERDMLRMYLRTKRFGPLRERISEYMGRFNDLNVRRQVGHMRPVCEHFLGLTHEGRKAVIHRQTVF